MVVSIWNSKEYRSCSRSVPERPFWSRLFRAVPEPFQSRNFGAVQDPFRNGFEMALERLQNGFGTAFKRLRNSFETAPEWRWRWMRVVKVGGGLFKWVVSVPALDHYWCLKAKWYLFMNGLENVDREPRWGWPLVIAEDFVNSVNKKIHEDRKFPISTWSLEFPNVGGTTLQNFWNLSLCNRWIERSFWRLVILLGSRLLRLQRSEACRTLWKLFK